MITLAPRSRFLHHRHVAAERVSLFVTCLVDLLYPEIGEATVALLEEAGVDVDVPAGQTCCGQPPYNSGYPDEARTIARTFLDAFEDATAVVTPSGSCAAMVRVTYPDLFRGTRDERRALALAGRTFELSEYLVDTLGAAPRGRLEARVTYHDSCHGLRELGLSGQGRHLLEGIDGLELVEMARPDACCGFGGTFSVRLPELATVMADDKLGQAEETGASVLVAGDAGCLMHLSGRGSRSGAPMRPVHLAVLLAEARGLR
ncbi:MAG TPA: (Fe-S)-binding protein [Actinomycetota bacterium]|jgi:L-lactate dehydrogenase complex protein LldE